MTAKSIHASVLVFPDVDIEPTSADDVSLALPGNTSFSLYVTQPNIVTLFTAGTNNGDELKGTLHFPDLLPSSVCRNITTLPRTSLYDDLQKTTYSSTHVIAFAPWSLGCNKEFLDRARDDRSDVQGFFFYTLDHMDQIPGSGNEYWDGIRLRDYGFPIYGMRGREGVLLMDKYTQYATEKSMLSDVNNMTGRARIFIDVDTGKRAPLPGLWLFLLIVMSVLLVAVGLTSLSMHLLQYYRRRSLRRRVAAGEVDLEALGIKRLRVPRKVLNKLPLRPYTTDKSDSYSQQSCSICLEDFVLDVTTVRELPCKHIYHPACIDSFLEQQSSLCPLCKNSALPKGYVPERLTNRTVVLERNARQQRERAARRNGERIDPSMWSRLKNMVWGRGGGRPGVDSRSDATPTPNAIEMRRRTVPAGSREGRSGVLVAEVEEGPVRGGKFRRAVRAVFPGFQ
ncbi:hypothetical protein BZA05DRAFT_60963 [Tricharina praecox]|uniref:uncharacterized protein n=1 Tax=Tricharina praecox TaxID=43433 RepID=UPI00221FC974|nr:uncharacterized protein BZA05DRAFT_60963 [Tricharina praecox]KAI5850685.1 hypothetical protein BZA05DRAFT_60963 [Tricharina praecox]